MRSWIRKYQLLTYFVLAYAIGFGAAFGFIYLNPGQRWENWSLPWFLFAFSPTISAVLVAWAVDGITGVKQLIAGFARWKVGVFWYLAAAYLFLGPLVIALIYGALGNPVAGLQPEVTIPILLGQIFFQLFSGPVSEEAGWRTRLRGLRANASRCSHAELDEAETLDDGNPAELGAEYRDLLRNNPQINVLGGCCGTDHRHIDHISRACGAAA